MEIETICRYKLPVTIVIFNNNGIYRGTDKNLGNGSDPSPTTLTIGARYDKMIEAFGGASFNVTTPEELRAALIAYEVGDTVRIVIFRSGRQYAADITLHESKG